MLLFQPHQILYQLLLPGTLVKAEMADINLEPAVRGEKGVYCLFLFIFLIRALPVWGHKGISI